MKKLIYFFFALSLSANIAYAQDANPQDEFWNQLKAHCGKAFSGKISTDPAPKDFAGKALSMYVMSCSENEIKIPFYVGDDHSRTWVFTKTPTGITLKHDHRLKDGSEDQLTQYGGTSSNAGRDTIQFFPADQQTRDLIPYAAGNIWWVTVDAGKYTYNLKRVDADNHFQVTFDLTKEIAIPSRPWGH